MGGSSKSDEGDWSSQKFPNGCYSLLYRYHADGSVIMVISAISSVTIVNHELLVGRIARENGSLWEMFVGSPEFQLVWDSKLEGTGETLSKLRQYYRFLCSTDIAKSESHSDIFTEDKANDRPQNLM
jgi:hypothetical protein